MARPHLAWLLLLPLVTTAAPAPVKPDGKPEAKPEGKPELAILSVGLDGKAEGVTPRLTRAAQEALAESGRFEAVPWELSLDPTATRDRTAKREEAKVAFQEGLQAYNDLDTEKALQWLERATKTYALTDLSRTWKEYVDATVMKAACQVANGDKSAAQLELSQLIAVAPDAALPESYFPPDMLAYAFKAKRAVGTGTLTIDTVPSGAEVYVDGAFKGFAPVELKGLAPQPHFITAKRAGFGLEQTKARDGKVTLSLKPAELGPDYDKAVAALQKSPGQDATARALAADLGANQLLLTTARKSTTGDRLEFSVQRIDVRDGHVLAHASGVLPLDPGLDNAFKATVAKLLDKDAPRVNGQAVTADALARNGGAVAQSGGAGPGFAWNHRHTGYALLGTAVAMLGAGTYCTLRTIGLNDTFQGSPQPQAAALVSTGRTYAISADVLTIGAVLAAGAGSWFAFIAPPPPAKKADVPMPPPPNTNKKKSDEDLRNY